MPRNLTVGDLRKVMAELPDDALVLTPGSDHSYDHASASAGTAVYERETRTFTEDYEEVEGTRVKCLIVS